MPLPDEVRKGMDSDVADIVNANADRMGGHARRRALPREFVADGLPWAHIDIAGPCYNTGEPNGYSPKGGTGVPVRTLLAIIEDLIADVTVLERPRRRLAAQRARGARGRRSVFCAAR